MLTVETIGRIRLEHLDKGKSIKEIARALHLSRNTVRRIPRSGETAFSYEREVQPRPKLGPWTGCWAPNAKAPVRERLTLIRVGAAGARLRRRLRRSSTQRAALGRTARELAGGVGEGQDRKGGAWGEFESECPGYCGAQDTFYVGNRKGVGRIYQQTFIDTYSKVAFAKLYDRKTPITAADLLNDRVAPFYDAREVRLCRVLTDRGTEYCGNPEHHEYELYLALGVWSRNEMARVDFEGGGVVRPFIADGLIGRSPS
jgi:Homeodomain-like domain